MRQMALPLGHSDGGAGQLKFAASPSEAGSPGGIARAAFMGRGDMVESQNPSREPASKQLHGVERQFRQKPAPRISGESQTLKRKWSKETYIAFLAALGILVHLIFRFGFRAPAPHYNWPLVLTLLIGGAP